MHLLNGIILQLLHMTKQLLNIQKLAEEHNIPRDQFEFQMLYGIRNERQLELVKEGYKMRVYVPYGNDWYGYFMRRLAERPANVAFVLCCMVKNNQGENTLVILIAEMHNVPFSSYQDIVARE